MKKTVCTLLVFAALSAAAFGGSAKTFSVSVDPPDAAIKVVSGNELKEQFYRSPATVTAAVPGDRELAKKAVMEITLDRFKPVIIPVRNIRNGEVLKVRLEKSARTGLTFALVAPAQSPDIQVKDDRATVRLRIDEQQMQMSLTNNTSGVIRVLWERASYIDVNNQSHRVMYPGVLNENRFQSLPPQSVMPYTTIHQPLIPVDHMVYNPKRKTAEVKPLFDNPQAVTGKAFQVIIPVAVNNEIVAYRLTIKAIME